MKDVDRAMSPSFPQIYLDGIGTTDWLQGLRFFAVPEIILSCPIYFGAAMSSIHFLIKSQYER